MHEMIRLCQMGEQNGFLELFNEYSPMAFRTAYLISGNRQMAEDITQEAFVQCFRKIKELQTPETFKSWFYKMIVRMSWRMCGKVKERASSFEDISSLLEDDHTQVADIQGLVEIRAENQDLYKALDQLSAKHRTVVILHYFNHMSTQEIAKTLGCFQGTVKSRLAYARKQLYQSMTTKIKTQQEQLENQKRSVISHG